MIALSPHLQQIPDSNDRHQSDGKKDTRICLFWVKVFTSNDLTINCLAPFPLFSSGWGESVMHNLIIR